MQPFGLPYGPFAQRSANAEDGAKSLAQLLGLPDHAYFTDGTLDVVTNALLLGDRDGQARSFAAGSVAEFDYLPLGEVFIKNAVAAQTGTVRVTGHIGYKGA